MKYLLILFAFTFLFAINANAQCTYSLEGAGTTIQSYGADSTVKVNTQPGCNWTITTSADWVTINNGGAGTGSGLAAYSVAVNNDTQRNTSLTIAGISYNVTQLGVRCVYTIKPTPNPVPASGGAVPYNITKNHLDCQIEERPFISEWLYKEVAEPNTGAARTVMLRFFGGMNAGVSFSTGNFEIIRVNVSQNAAKSRKRVRFF
jgi:hypothetical protein